MKATIKKKETFDITIGDDTYYGFKKVDEWDGMSSYENEDGFIVATTPNDLDFSVCNAFDQAPETNIVSCSPYFLLNKKDNKEKHNTKGSCCKQFDCANECGSIDNFRIIHS